MENCYFIDGPWAGRCSNLPAHEYHLLAVTPPLTSISKEPVVEETIQIQRFRYNLHPFRTPERVWNIYAPPEYDDDMIMSELVHTYMEAKSFGRADAQAGVTRMGGDGEAGSVAKP